ncbi:MAG: TrmJ/YjtD family RNA methyltransferase [Nanoarchaeota archaeon]|nr:TrmJ/YjtD family RNA methyltransferase [Nanoarchaeota archaeon]
MISIVLIEPETPGNIGAVARAMSNFGQKRLVIVNPKCDPFCKDAYDRATNGRLVLDTAKITDISCLSAYDLVIGTTAKLGTDYNIMRSPMLPEDLAKKINKIDKRKKIALVFGRESKGLLNQELKLCDFSVTIPSTRKKASFNLSHAVAIILYEICKHDNIAEISERFPIMTRKEKDVLLKLIDRNLDAIAFSTKEKRETQKIVWRHVLGKSMLTKREAFALMGFFRKK